MLGVLWPHLSGSRFKVKIDYLLNGIAKEEVIWSFKWKVSISLFKSNSFGSGLCWGAFSTSFSGSCGISSLADEELFEVWWVLKYNVFGPLALVFQVINEFH